MKIKHVYLAGNPNAGKSTLFNRLTGLRQKTSNLPGTTVEKRSGTWNLPDGTSCTLTDLPGAYGFMAASEDESQVLKAFADTTQWPDAIIYVADASNLERHLLFFTELAALGIPMILALTMTDMATARGLQIDINALSAEIGVLVIPLPPGDEKALQQLAAKTSILGEGHIPALPIAQPYKGKALIEAMLTGQGNITEPTSRIADAAQRARFISGVLTRVVVRQGQGRRLAARWLDRIFTHPVFGFIGLFLILYTVFQAVFSLAEAPMEWIETGMSGLTEWLHGLLPEHLLSDLLTGGILPGLAGVLVFIPQIALLFMLLSVLEDSGYMPRAAFITDRLMRAAGLNGRSIIPLTGGLACAIPSIMAARAIPSRKDRLITILVTPLMSCSARIPVYALLIPLAIPDGTRWGWFDAQGLVLTLVYMSGAILALTLAAVLKLFISKTEESRFAMELPSWQWPRPGNVLQTMWQKSRAFVVEAGKVIVLISVVLWALASYGPGNAMQEAELKAGSESLQRGEDSSAARRAGAAAALQESYAGRMGRAIEPVIAPLGFDWKTGIALITSFAAREVFVGTMSTIYAVGSEDFSAIRDKMQAERIPETGEARYGMPFALSLIAFYALALQCMSTIAVVRRETGGWKWPLIQLGILTGMAWLGSYVVFHLATYFSA
jgi:ferrous iron transport protein B